jgi:hypothetical protein
VELAALKAGTKWMEKGRASVYTRERIYHSCSLQGPVAASGSNPQTDSMMRANGMDPYMMSGMSGNPSDMISLYKAETGKGKRKILMMKMGGMGFGSKKQTSSDKYTFSVRKVREGYWELVIDKTLPKGEYAFSIMGRGVSGMDGSTMLYAFGVD